MRRGKKIEIDGLDLKSKLELYQYELLKKHGLFEGYENESFQL